MNESSSYLSYEFYFLFRKEIEYQGKTTSEPFSVQEKIAVENELIHSFLLDQDKRIFRYFPVASETGKLPPLEKWVDHLQQGWQQVVKCYMDYFKKMPPSSPMDANTFCHQTLMGVALVIMDDTIASHQIKLSTPQGEATFKTSTRKIPAERILLRVEDVTPDGSYAECEERMVKPAYLEEFESEYRELELQGWQIQIQPPCLIPVAKGENHPNPVFAVYGLAHGRTSQVTEADWPEHYWPLQLQEFLSSGETAVLAYLIPRLLMQKWQFIRLHWDAELQHKQLEETCESYNQQHDSFTCYRDGRLEAGLRDLASFSAETKKVLARLDRARRTLEINRNNLERELRRSREVWQILDTQVPQAKKRDWNLIWQNGTTYTPLFDKFHLDLRRLENDVTYLKGSLDYLERIRAHWQTLWEERRLKVEKKIVFVGNFLVLVTLVVGIATLVATLATMTTTDNSNTWNTWKLELCKPFQWKQLFQWECLPSPFKWLQNPIFIVLVGVGGSLWWFMIVPIWTWLREWVCLFRKAWRK